MTGGARSPSKVRDLTTDDAEDLGNSLEGQRHQTN